MHEHRFIVRFAIRLSSAGPVARYAFLLGLAGLAIVVPALWLMPKHWPVAVGAQVRLSHTAHYGLVTWFSLDQRWREPPGHVAGPDSITEDHLESTVQWNIHPRGVLINSLASLGFAALLVVMWKKLMRDNVQSRPCGGCGYDLRGHSQGPCPECGVPPERLTSRRLLLNTDSRAGHFMRAGVILVLMGAFAWVLGGGLAVSDAVSFVRESRAGTLEVTSSHWWGRVLQSMALVVLVVATYHAADAIKNRRK